MKRILAFAFAATACTSANASPWHQFTPESYFLIPSNSKDILAFANLFNGKMNVALSDASGQYCEKGEDKAPTPAGVFKVNDQYVKFIQGCLNGKRMLVPETQAGRDFLLLRLPQRPPR
ncbi:TPA: hypothetical protein QEM96_000974 [Pseudomonas putida]|nr:hypothetical protein [Pseudomonas putida]